MPLDLTPSSARIKIASVYIHHAWDVSCGLFLPLSLWFVLLSMGSFLLSSHFSFSFNLSVYHPCLSLSWFSFLFPLSLWCHTLWSHARVCVFFFFFVFQSWIFSFTCTSRFLLLKRIFLLHFSIFFFFFFSLALLCLPLCTWQRYRGRRTASALSSVMAPISCQLCFPASYSRWGQASLMSNSLSG